MGELRWQWRQWWWWQLIYMELTIPCSRGCHEEKGTMFTPLYLNRMYLSPEIFWAWHSWKWISFGEICLCLMTKNPWKGQLLIARLLKDRKRRSERRDKYPRTMWLTVKWRTHLTCPNRVRHDHSQVCLINILKYFWQEFAVTYSTNFKIILTHLIIFRLLMQFNHLHLWLTMVIF